jgi:hypothetical protein
MYNFDETGFMMGVITTATVVTSSEGRARVKKIQPGNREWVTVIQGVSSQGWNVPPFVVVAGKNHLLSWYQNSGFPPNWVIGVTDNGWTTNEMGMDWIRHFEKYIKARTIGGFRLLILDGHESHHSDEFKEYCKEHNIVTLYIPPHSSHILQPLDVGCFSPLKKAYSRQIEDIMRSHIIHISKDDFFPAFHAAFNIAMTESNIRGGFEGLDLCHLALKVYSLSLILRYRRQHPQTPARVLPKLGFPKRQTTQLKLHHRLHSSRIELPIIKIAL